MKILQFIRRHKLAISFNILLLILLIAVILPPISIINNAQEKIFSVDNAPDKPIAIVFGAAIYQNKIPSDVLGDRLKIAAELYLSGKVNKILMTGGNPEFDHNEPQVMKNFTILLGIPSEDIHLDFAGFRTYDSCARANKIFKVEEAILVTQDSHLPRAIFLCENFGIQSIGVTADLQEYHNWNKQLFRELLAQIFAFWEIKLFKHDPKYLGEEIPI